MRHRRPALTADSSTSPVDALTPEIERRSRPSVMGYQPGLDGLRAIAVTAVICYHAGFSWMRGGFIGVEVFFVVSGYLITTLLIDEQARSGTVSLAAFWARRARRLLPALFVVLVAVAGWAALFGSAAQVGELRRDLPWSIAYFANWGQILGDVPYFATGDPTLLRHLWSLAVEEQWYLVWPLTATLLLRSRLGGARRAATIAVVAVAVMVFTAWVATGGSSLLGGIAGVFEGVDRTNFAYLSTITRSSGLLLGAAAAFVWRPWRSSRAVSAPSTPLDVPAGIALGVLMCVALAATVASPATYQWVLPVSSVASLVVVLAVVHPAAVGIRSVLASPVLVAVGRRSYGLYLWHWPVFVVVGVTDGSWMPFVTGLVVAVVLSELCFRFVEEPVRRGALRGWRDGVGLRWTAPVGATAVVAMVLTVHYVGAEPFDPAVGGDEVEFVAFSSDADTGVADVTDEGSSGAEDASGPDSTVPRVVVLGDSQAHSLAVNAPAALADVLEVVNGSIPGCGVYDRGAVLTRREGFDNDFAACAGWQEEWAAAAAGADLALVMLGAWDVFDLELGGYLYPFDTPQADDLFRRSLGSGIDAVLASGADVALLEAPCMRPVDAAGAAVPALPERGDDERIAHVNELFREIAGTYPDGRVTFVEGPTEWCTDESIATDLGYRWDGVHVYRPGASLIFSSITPALVELTS